MGYQNDATEKPILDLNSDYKIDQRLQTWIKFKADRVLFGKGAS